MTNWPAAPCNDCDLDLNDIGEMCMLEWRVWDSVAQPDRPDYLCIGCIENRLGFQLTPADFDMTYPQNTKPGKSARMMSRMQR